MIVKVNTLFILIALFAMTTPARGDDDLCSASQQSASAAAIKAAFPYQGSFDHAKKRVTVNVKKGGRKVSLSTLEKAGLQSLTVADDQGHSCVLRSPVFALEKTTEGCDPISVWVARYKWDARSCAVQNPIIFIPGVHTELHAPSPQVQQAIKPELIALSQQKPFSPVAIQCPEISGSRMFQWKTEDNRTVLEVDRKPRRFGKTGIMAEECMHSDMNSLDIYYCRHPLSAEGSVSSAYTMVFDGSLLVFAIFDGTWTGADSYSQFNYDRQEVIASYAVGQTVLYVFRGGYVLYRDGNNWYAAYRQSFLYNGAVECGGE